MPRRNTPAAPSPFRAYDLGEDFALSDFPPTVDHTFGGVIARYYKLFDLQPEGYGIDKTFRDIYLCAGGRAHRSAQPEAHLDQCRWPAADPAATRHHLRAALRLQGGDGETHRRACAGGSSAPPRKAPSATNPAPSPAAASPRFPSPSRTPCSPPRCWSRDLHGRFRRGGSHHPPQLRGPLSGCRPDPDKPSRPLLSPQRSLGSVIRLLTPSPHFTAGIQRLARHHQPRQ